MKYKIGQTVKVKNGVLCPDDSEFNLSGWAGRIIDLDEGEEPTVCIEFDSINDKNIKEVSKQIKKAFDEIHTNTFVRYNFEIIAGSSSEKSELFVSVIDNSEENTAIIERVYKDKNSLH